MPGDGQTRNDSPSANAAIGLKSFLDGVTAAVRSVPEQWVRCELHSLKIGDRYTNIEFLEHGTDDKPVATLRGGCFPAAWQRITKQFAEAGLSLEAGSQVMVKLRAKVDSNFGLQADLLDIDLNFALGDLKAREQKIRKELQDEGVWEKNKNLPQPADFLRVAVIAPEGAAGLGDFRSTADRIVAAGLAQFDYYSAPFQTKEAPKKIIDVLRNIFGAGKEGKYCAVAIIRGGGASTDLTWLLDHHLVRAVCLMNMPVMTGIGHERDKTLLDEVACMTFDTPSKVIEHIKATITAGATSGENAWATIRAQASHALGRYESGRALAKNAVDRDSHEALRLAETAVRLMGANTGPAIRGALDDLTVKVRGNLNGIDRSFRETLHLAETGVRAASMESRPAARDTLDDASLRLVNYRNGIERDARQIVHSAEIGVRHLKSSIGPSASETVGLANRSLGEKREVIRAFTNHHQNAAASALRELVGEIRDSAEAAIRPAEMGTRNAKGDIRILLEIIPRNVHEDLSRIERQISSDAAQQTQLAAIGVIGFQQQISQDARQVLDRCANAIAMVRERADALNPRNVLAAGYAILRDDRGMPLTGIEAVRHSANVTAEMRDGDVQLHCTETLNEGSLS